MLTRLRQFRREKQLQCRGSSSRVRARKQQSRRPYGQTNGPLVSAFRKTDSATTSSSDSEDSSQPIQAKGKVVHFDTAGQRRDTVSQEIIYIDRCQDASLWWTAEELDDIRSTIIQVIKNCGQKGIHEIAEAMSDYLALGFEEESIEGAASLLRVMSTYDATRGLEHLCTQEKQAAVNDHRYNVLMTQELVLTTRPPSPWRSQSDIAESLRIASLRVSKATGSLAYRKAQYDKKAAASA